MEFKHILSILFLNTSDKYEMQHLGPSRVGTCLVIFVLLPNTLTKAF